jgi:hypothetical protein
MDDAGTAGSASGFREERGEEGLLRESRASACLILQPPLGYIHLQLYCLSTVLTVLGYGNENIRLAQVTLTQHIISIAEGSTDLVFALRLSCQVSECMGDQVNSFLGSSRPNT